MGGKAWTSETAPRKGKPHRQYSFTVKDISRATGRSERTIRKDVAAGKLKLTKIDSIARYIMKHPQGIAE